MNGEVRNTSVVHLVCQNSIVTPVSGWLYYDTGAREVGYEDGIDKKIAYKSPSRTVKSPWGGVPMTGQLVSTTNIEGGVYILVTHWTGVAFRNVSDHSVVLRGTRGRDMVGTREVSGVVTTV